MSKNKVQDEVDSENFLKHAHEIAQKIKDGRIDRAQIRYSPKARVKNHGIAIHIELTYGKGRDS